MEQKTRGF
jgi:ATP-dependent Zn protease